MSVTTVRNGPVTTVILDRPACRNAVDGPTATALREAFVAFEHDVQAKVAVLWGNGGHFCAGADLKAVAAGASDFCLDPDGPGPMGPTRMHLSKPVIAAISGYAVAGGLELALWCDLRVAECDATLGVFCRRFGVPLIDGGTVRLPRIIGMGRALDLILTGRPVGAGEALAMGLVNRVVAPGQARVEAETLAATIAEHPYQCMLADRHSAYDQWDMSLSTALSAEGRGGLQVLRSESIPGAQRFASGRGRHGEPLANLGSVDNTPDD